MTLEEYIAWTDTTWQASEEDEVHAALGLAGETGEVVDLIKKARFTPGRLGPDEFNFKLDEELGDVLYYWARLCAIHGVDPAEVIRGNIAKLERRWGAKEAAIAPIPARAGAGRS
jgi:NTP pyrophosphatase (non-canonical NTP hydrolase)